MAWRYFLIGTVISLYRGLAKALSNSFTLTFVPFGQGFGLLFTNTLQVLLARGILNSTILPKPSWFCCGVKFTFSNCTCWSFAMFEGPIGDHRALGDQDVFPDRLCGRLIDSFITNCFCDLCKKLKKEKKVV